MAFTSHIFLFYFLPAFLLLYHLVPQRWLAARNILLLAAGYVFYGWVSLRFAALLFGLTVLNYVLSRFIAATGAKRMRLFLTGLAIAIDLAVLAFFKYIVFAEENLNGLLLLVGRDPLPMLRVVLPVGISFYTFKVISVIVDTCRGQTSPGGTLKRSLGVDSGVEKEPSPRPSALTMGSPNALFRVWGPLPPRQIRSLLDFACYVSFFPQLLSGPIQRFGTIDRKSEAVPTFADQLAARGHTLDKFSRGVALFMLGFAKKILLANAVAQVADAVFAAASPGTLDAWFGALAYSFQLYFDFSAYSEMAIGVGLMLGFECPRNFDAPYRADSFGDFWRRWHISLSSWLRDYLYIPLGGSRAGAGRTYANLMVVFLLCGLWHGAGWTFIVWGAWHGLWLIVERIRKGIGLKGRMGPIGRFTTFFLVTIGWVVFRATDLGDAWRMLAIMLWPRAAQGGSTLLSAMIYTRGHLILMVLCALLVFQPVQGFDWTRRLSWPRVLTLAILFALSLMTLFAQSFRSFLYFQF